MNARGWVARLTVRGLLAALAVLTLLFVFQQVVSGAVTQGALRRDVAAQLHSATWHCKALHAVQERQDCLLLIPPVPMPIIALWPAAGEVPQRE